MSRRKFIVGNWKMNTTLASGRELARAVAAGVSSAAARVAVCPPFPYLAAIAESLQDTPVELGAQNCYPAASGAFTGEVSPAMLLDVGCQHVILGHSERRHGLAETDDFIARKAKLCLDTGLSVILCVGETLDERNSGQTEAVLLRQLTGSTLGLPAEHIDRLVIAYEPVWAIGTGVNATPQQAHDAHAFIRTQFAKLFGDAAAQALIIQYGGSVKADNAATILQQADVDGALVGGASLQSESFLSIVRAAG